MMETQKKIDMRRPVAAMEAVLQRARSGERRQEVLALLRCWQADEILDDESRARAEQLVQKFRPRCFVRR